MLVVSDTTSNLRTAKEMAWSSCKAELVLRCKCVCNVHVDSVYKLLHVLAQDKIISAG